MMPKSSLIVLFSIVALALVGAAFVAGCGGKDSPTVTATTNDQLKSAHECVANIRTTVAKGDPRKSQLAVSNAASFIGTLSEWIAGDGKANVEERKKAIMAAAIMLSDEVLPLATADTVDQAKLDAKLAEVDKLISQAE